MMTKMIQRLKGLLAVVLFAPGLALASEAVHLDKAPVSTDQARLQRGAKIFVNNCMGCHGLSFVRYNHLEQIGLTSEEIEKNLIFTAGAKVGDLMVPAIQAADAKRWFGVRPPDLTLVTRARSSEFGSGADWVYTYLRKFYRDPERPTGWNNEIFPNVGMPHVLYEFQGEQTATVTQGEHGDTLQLSLTKPGKLSTEHYDEAVADLVSFLVWTADPSAGFRKTLGLFVIGFLCVLLVLTYLLKLNYWKDVH